MRASLSRDNTWLLSENHTPWHDRENEREWFWSSCKALGYLESGNLWQVFVWNE